MSDLHPYTFFTKEQADSFAKDLLDLSELHDSKMALPLIILINDLLYVANDALKVWDHNIDDDYDEYELRDWLDEAHNNIVNIQWKLEDNKDLENKKEI